MTNFFKHLKTIATHRKYVRRACFKMGLFWQGLTHDLSKYGFIELSIYRYYSGKRSPHQNCRDVLGYSPSWNHHYHKNKHHFQFWWDEDEDGKIIPVQMPYKYVIESVCDMLGASKAYNKENWKPEMLWNYWLAKCKDKRIMHPVSVYLTEKLLWNLQEMGEEHFFDWFKHSSSWLKDQYEQGLADY